MSANEPNYRDNLVTEIQNADRDLRERDEYISRLVATGHSELDVRPLRNELATRTQRRGDLADQLAAYDQQKQRAGSDHDDWQNLGSIATTAEPQDLNAILQAQAPQGGLRLSKYGAWRVPHYHLLVDMRMHHRDTREPMRTELRERLTNAFRAPDGRVVEFAYW